MIVCVIPVYAVLLCQFGINLSRCHVSLCVSNHMLSRMHTHAVSSLMHYICLVIFVAGSRKVRVTFLAIMHWAPW